MDKKEIIYELASGVQLNELTPAVSYGSIRRKVKQNGISEIAFYSCIADHLEENDIHPSRFVKDTARIFKEIAKNPFVLKTDDTFHFLGKQYDDIKLSGLDDRKFLCNKCFLIKPMSEHSGHHNYANTCRACVNSLTYKRSKKAAVKSKEVKAATPVQEVEEVEQVIEPIEVEQITMDPYLEVESIIGEKNFASITVKLPVKRIPEFFQVIQDCIKEEPEEPTKETTEE